MSTKTTAHSRLALSPMEAAQAIDISRNKMYNLLKTDSFPCKHIGGRIVIPVEALKKWLENEDNLMGTAQLNLPSAELSARRFGGIR